MTQLYNELWVYDVLFLSDENDYKPKFHPIKPYLKETKLLIYIFCILHILPRWLILHLQANQIMDNI